MDALMILGELHMTLDPRLQQKRFGIRCTTMTNTQRTRPHLT